MTNMIIINNEEYYNHPFIYNYLANKNGDIYSLKSKKILSKNRNNGKGYLIFSYYDTKLKKTKNYYYHRFIYEVFNDIIPKFMEVDHRNGVKNDNNINNLQLLSHKQNVEKSNNKPIISICLNTGDEKRFISIKKASEELIIFESNISAICKNKNKTAKSKKEGCKYTFKFLH